MEKRTHCDLFFSDSSHGWIATGGAEGPGAIHRTRDGGLTWQEVARQGFDAHGHRLFSVQFINNLEGWACGEHGEQEDGVLWRTRDNGESWEVWEAGAPKSGLPHSHPFFQVCFPRGDMGFLLSGGLPLLVSKDGGRNWSRLEISGAEPHGMTFLDDGMTGFIISQRLDTLTWQPLQTGHFRTVDGGQTWTPLNDSFEGVELGLDVAASRFWNPTRGVLCGPEGALFTTSDGAKSWQPVDHPFREEDLHSLCILPGGKAFLGGSGGLVALSHNHGKSWYRLHFPVEDEVHRVWFFPDDRGFVVGEKDMAYRTENRGRTWKKMALPY